MKIINKPKKAATLTEVLIVLGIISTTLVASLALIVNSMIKIKQNEIQDTANGVMIKGLELAKSPKNIAISELPRNGGSTEVNTFYRITSSSVGASVLLEKVEEGTSSLNQGCTSTSPYNIKTSPVLSQLNAGYDICLQLNIVYLSSNTYKITSQAVYTFLNRSQTSFITGVRYASFN